MRLTLHSHGGWSGLVTPPLVIDTAALPAEAADEVARLAAAARSAPGPSSAALAAGRARAPEAMSCTITIEDEGGTATLKSSDVAGHSGIEALADWIRQHAPR